jgi:Fis family transcriptional regulator
MHDLDQNSARPTERDRDLERDPDAGTGGETGAVERLVGLPVAEVERDLILATLRETGGNRTRAARLLGIAIRTLRNKLGSYAAEGHAIPEPAAGPPG